MLALLGDRLLTAIESGDSVVKIVTLTSLINRSTRHAFEMILITEREIIGWVGCWKRAESMAKDASAPRIWMNDTKVYVNSAAGMEEGFAVELETPAKAEHLAHLLQNAFDEAFDSIQVGERKWNRFMARNTSQSFGGDDASTSSCIEPGDAATI